MVYSTERQIDLTLNDILDYGPKHAVSMHQGQSSLHGRTSAFGPPFSWDETLERRAEKTIDPIGAQTKEGGAWNARLWRRVGHVTRHGTREDLVDRWDKTRGSNKDPRRVPLHLPPF